MLKNLSKTDLKNFLINDCIKKVLFDEDFDIEKIKESYDDFLSEKDIPFVSITLSYIALFEYKKDKDYYKALNTINNAKYLLNSSDLTAKKINLICLAKIEFLEGNKKNYIDLLNKSIEIKTDEFIFDNELIKLLNSNLNPSSNIAKDDALLAFLQVGRTIAVETNLDNLLTIIAEQIQFALGADRCTVFLYDKKTDELWSKVALGLKTEEIRFSINKGLAGHVFKTGETINIKNAYESEYFNKEIDLQTGYKTKNILCMPIRNLSHKILGVIQVLNKFSGDFTKRDEELLVAIGSSAGIAIENANLFLEQKNLIDEQKKLFSSFINTLAASIDARDKITAGHSKRVEGYAELISENINLDDKQKEIIKSASMLHDIGKIGIKDSVLQKEGKLTDEEYAHIKEHVKFTNNILKNVSISDEFIEITEIASTHHEKFDGTGYFKGLKGTQIPLGGRILAICDVFDAITSKRHYRSKMEILDALNIIKQGANKHFDNDLVNAFMSLKCYDILKVMFDNEFNTIKKDEILLKKFKLDDLYAILINNKTNELTEVFNKYYLKT